MNITVVDTGCLRLKCRLCGKGFDCIGREGMACWCAFVNTEEDQLARIRNMTDSCV